MRLVLVIEGVTAKAMDDAALEAISYLRDVEELLVTDYYIEEDDE